MTLRSGFSLAIGGFFLIGCCQAATTSPLLARGYAVIPEPQQASLSPKDFRFGAEWSVEAGQGVDRNSEAQRWLGEELDSRFHISLGAGSSSVGVLRLEIAPNSVTPGQTQDRDIEAIKSQAYKLDLSAAQIRIVANAPAGLFYGLETFVQLLKRRDGALWLPEGQIVDWPDLQIRSIYWDDAHHLERLPELKRAVRQAAFFKINGFVIKLEGHFQYASAPAVVEPYALSPAEFQELTDYGLRYHVQVIPYLDGPAHIAFILKHPEYAGLRSFPDSNYEACATNPDTYKLLTGMYQDLLAANKGVKYFYVSTDEPYYIGMADNSQCHEAARAKELGSVGKLLAEFVTKTANYLHDRGRTVVFWGEFPLKAGDISSLPSHAVNGETYGPEFDPLFKAHGMRQMFYASTQGEEELFPDYFLLPPSRRLHHARGSSGRVSSGIATIASNPARQTADLMGVMVAGWADAGLHPEVFWLGYATITAAGWRPDISSARESMSSFNPLFYGPAVTGMERAYQLMSYQAQLWVDSWDTKDSTSRKPIWGNSDKIFTPRRPAHDEVVPLPGVPSPADLSYQATWSRENAQRLNVIYDGGPENQELIGLLNTNLTLAEHNRYGLEVFLSIANLYRQNLDMLTAFAHLDRSLASASDAAKKQNYKDALESIDQALEAVRNIRTERNTVLRDAIATWYKSWQPRVAEANGRRFLHEVDDVKDHHPDRTVDMSYLVYRELLLPMDDWYERVQAARNQFAEAHHLPVRKAALDWKSLN
jgi:hexosaminidase